MDFDQRFAEVTAQIEAADQQMRAALARRDQLAREAIDAKVTWKRVQAGLGLSPRGLKIVLARTAPESDSK